MRSVYSHRAAISSGRCGGTAHMTGALPGIDTGALGRAGWDGGEARGRVALYMRAGEMHGALPRAR